MPIYQDLERFNVPSGFRGKSKITVQLWWVVQTLFFKMSPQVLFEWRNFLLRLFGAKIGKGVKIRPKVTITYPWKITVGDYSWIGDECVLYSLGNIKIGSNVAIAHRVYINTGLHDYTKKSFDIKSDDVFIDNECWITNDVYIGPGVKIGFGTVIGARSSVYCDLPDAVVCVGNPAKIIKKRKIE